MVNLKNLFNEYNFNLNVKKVKKEQKELAASDHVSVIANFQEDSFVASKLFWPMEFLPKLNFNGKISGQSLEMIETLKSRDITKEKNEKIVKILTKIDFELICAVTAEDLISYDGHSSSLSLSHILNKNNSLLVFTSLKFDKKRTFSLLKHSLKYKNYNLIDILSRRLQSARLTNKELKTVKYYEEFLTKQENGIYPFNWLLKDCEDCNTNSESDMASIKFCKIVARLKEMKNLNLNFKVKRSDINTMYIHIWETVKVNPIITFEKSEEDESLFLII